MIYNSIHTIPSRLFFQIVETGNITLLDTKKSALKLSQRINKLILSNGDKERIKEQQSILDSKLKNLELIWIELEEADHKLSKNPRTDKFLNTSKSIEVLRCKQKKVELAISYLRIQDDEELRGLLMKSGHSFTDNLVDDLKKIERFNRDIDVQIGKLELKLPKQEKNKPTPFDELVIGYGMVAGQTYKTNEITQSEFRALENNVKQKLEQLAKQTPKDGGKR